MWNSPRVWATEVKNDGWFAILTKHFFFPNLWMECVLSTIHGSWSFWLENSSGHFLVFMGIIFLKKFQKLEHFYLWFCLSCGSDGWQAARRKRKGHTNDEGCLKIMWLQTLSWGEILPFWVWAATGSRLPLNTGNVASAHTHRFSQTHVPSGTAPFP